MRDVHVLVIQDGPMQALGTKSAKDPSSLKCEQCNKTFSRSWLLKNHQRVHTGERPYKCAFCDKAFADKSNLRQHQKIHTTTEKLFQCGICQRTFAQRRYLMKHATEIHRDVWMSLNGAPQPEKKEKEDEPVKPVVEKQATKVSSAASVQTTPEIPNKSADHQYLTRQKSRTKTVSESKETKEKKYSEQDLKDFIKSNQKTMEKNGYIFIKQNFESLDTEPTLTEISEVPVTAIKDEVALKTDEETGNQILNVNGKMVYLQMENKLITTQALSQNTQVSTQSMSDPSTQSATTNILKGKKLVAKKDSGVRRQANILKASGAKKGHENIVSGSAVKLVNVANLKQTITKPVHLIPGVAQNVPTEPLTLVQVMPQGLSVVPNQGPYIVPVSVVQMPNHGQPLLVAPNSSTFKTVSVPSINSVSTNNTIVNSAPSTDISIDTSQQVIEIQSVPVCLDEKGAAGDMSGSQGVNPTPIVSDAPWQGIVNINSEQELYEYINSQSVSTVENDQGMTILIQNVDSQNGAVMSLDSQNLLSGSGNFSNVFHDQSTIISDVLPESVNIAEVQINSDESASQNSNQNEGERNLEISNETFTEEKVNEEDSSLVIIKEEVSNDSDDAQSQVMLTEANREHLSDQEDFTGDQNEKMLLKSENESDQEPFSDHSVYTAHEVKCEIGEKPDQLMETDDCESAGMVIDDHSAADNNIEAEHSNTKDEA